MKSKAPGPSLVAITKRDSSEQSKKTNIIKTRIYVVPAAKAYPARERSKNGHAFAQKRTQSSGTGRHSCPVRKHEGMICPTKVYQSWNKRKCEAKVHFHIGMNTFDGSCNITQRTIHDCLGTLELFLGNDSARLEIRYPKTWSPWRIQDMNRASQTCIE
jgi:hypothetical protein